MKKQEIHHGEEKSSDREMPPPVRAKAARPGDTAVIPPPAGPVLRLTHDRGGKEAGGESLVFRA